MATSDGSGSHSLSRWTVSDSVETYAIDAWGRGYFSVNEHGNMAVHPRGPNQGTIDMKALIDDLSRRGIDTPVLLRFSDILASRIELIHQAFAEAIEQCEYRGEYRGVFPIKVNQARQVVEEVVAMGRPYHYGLEAGSKPELLVVMAMHDDPDALIVCNGYKDEAYVETALYASRLGRKVVLVIEKLSELQLVRDVSERIGITPTLGLRARLSARGSGRWEQSGGDRAKFGLSAGQLLSAAEQLREWDALDSLELLHFHLGSQISAIRSIKNALREAARFYVELHRLGCARLQYFDVGGGLGVDYDGSQTNFASSTNYTVQEYANDVVYAVQQICDEANLPHPTLVSESGRAVAAHHSVLVVNVVGSNSLAEEAPPRRGPDDHAVLSNLHEVYHGLTQKNLLESYHDAVEYKDQAWQLFTLGHLSLPARVRCEQVFWATLERVRRITRTLERAPEDLSNLERLISDTYFCNVSIFQSLPDSWAIGQLFPIAPIHRLHEEPTRRGVLVDITCDSDGRIDSFAALRDVKRVLELHTLRDREPYQLGIFLVGAYQEILGDLHNLFGDTNAVHVTVADDGTYEIADVVSGDTISDVLGFVHYQEDALLRKVRTRVEAALREGMISLDESRQIVDRFQAGMAGYTYLEER